MWGELCIGLSAPRSSGVNQDNNSSLSFEVVKVMLECGMAHSLMHGIRRIKLHHPMAAAVAAALLRFVIKSKFHYVFLLQFYSIFLLKVFVFFFPKMLN